MKIKLSLLILSFFIFSCSSEPKQEKANITKKSETAKQLNISILLDLSDRVIQPLEPSQSERDIEVVSVLIDIFKNSMQSKGAFMSKDKIKVLFNPIPSDPNINSIAKILNIDLSTSDNKGKKEIYDSIENDFEQSLKDIYTLTIQNRNWIGSDIWRFFKNDAKDLCIESDSTYKNILIILTDGYIYHNQSVERQKNRTSYLTGKYLHDEGFRNNSNWKEKLDVSDYGLINPGVSLEGLEVIVLEINPSENHRNDEDIIKGFMTKWFKEMNISNFVIYNTDLPENTKKRIENFFKK